MAFIILFLWIMPSVDEKHAESQITDSQVNLWNTNNSYIGDRLYKDKKENE